MAKATKEEKDTGQEIALQETPQGSTALDVYDAGEDAGAGVQNVGKGEIAIPFLRILQKQSPQCRPVANGGMAGAKPGMIINTGTNQLFDGETGLPFVPVHRDHNFGEFYPRPPDGPGGFLGLYQPDDPLVLRLRAEQGEFGKLEHKDERGADTEIIEAYYLYGLINAQGMTLPVLVPFASTQIKKYRNFMGQVTNIKYKNKDGNAIQPAMWAHQWVLGTVFEQKGPNDFYGWRLALKEDTALASRLEMKSDLYLAGKELFKLIEGGGAKVDYNKSQPTTKEEEIPM